MSTHLTDVTIDDSHRVTKEHPMTPETAAPRPALAPSARIALVVAIVAIALKLPQAVIGLVAPGGIDGLTPVVNDPNGVVIGIVWVGFSLALLAFRRWLGAISAMFFSIVSLVSGLGFLTDGPVIWGVVQVVTAAVAIIAIALAALRGAFKGSRW